MPAASLVSLPGLGRVLVARPVLQGRFIGLLLRSPGQPSLIVPVRGPAPSFCNHLVKVGSGHMAWFFWCDKQDLQ